MLVSATDALIFSYSVVYARWVVSVVLMVAGVAKVQNVSDFVVVVQSFGFLPKQFSQVVARLIIGLELILGLALFVGFGVRLIAITAALLFAGFTGVVLVNLVRHNILDCNCFGPYFKEKINVRTVIRNFLFMILCFWVWQFYDGYLALESWFFGKPALQDHPFEPFLLLTAAIIVSGLSISIAMTILKNFKSAASGNSLN